MIPAFLVPSCFWDCDPRAVDLRTHRRFVVERVMEYGDDEAIRWLLRTYTGEELSDTLRQSRNLSPKTATCWANYLGLEEGGVPCISRSCLPGDMTSWRP